MESQIETLREVRKLLHTVIGEEDIHEAITAMLAKADDLICNSIKAMRTDW